MSLVREDKIVRTELLSKEQKERQALGRREWVWIIVLLLLFSGCSSKRLWEKSKSLSKSIWYRQQALTFHFLIRDAQQPCHIFLQTRYEESYPYHNMYVSYTLSNIQGQVLSEASTEVQLFDPKDGKPLGSGSSNFFFRADTLLSSYRFSVPGRYTMEIRQFMRLDSLVGLRNIGIRIDKATTD